MRLSHVFLFIGETTHLMLTNREPFFFIKLSVSNEIESLSVNNIGALFFAANAEPLRASGKLYPVAK